MQASDINMTMADYYWNLEASNSSFSLVLKGYAVLCWSAESI